MGRAQCRLSELDMCSTFSKLQKDKSLVPYKRVKRVPKAASSITLISGHPHKQTQNQKKEGPHQTCSMTFPSSHTLFSLAETIFLSPYLRSCIIIFSLFVGIFIKSFIHFESIFFLKTK